MLRAPSVGRTPAPMSCWACLFEHLPAATAPRRNGQPQRRSLAAQVVRLPEREHYTAHAAQRTLDPSLPQATTRAPAALCHNHAMPSSFAPEPPYTHGQAERTAVLLCNLGTPDEATAPAVRRYLAQFLGDHRVVEIPKVAWLPILHGIILRTRPAQSAAKYASVWTPEGSPLAVWTAKQATLLRGWLGEAGHAVLVRHAMRYGNPSIASQLDALKAEGATRILILPLYPQYSGTTTASMYTTDGQNILIEVSDDGMGIEESNLARVFERFFRTTEGRSRDVTGRGLGLAICKHIVEAHGHNIHVRSKIDIGTTIGFTLDTGKKNIPAIAHP